MSVPVAVPLPGTKITVPGDITKVPSPRAVEDDDTEGEGLGAENEGLGVSVVPGDPVAPGVRLAPGDTAAPGVAVVADVAAGPGAVATPEAEGARPIPPFER